MVLPRIFEIIRSEETSQMQWSQDPSEIDGYNLNNIRCETSRNFRNKKGITKSQN
jgi:hypothetical protein